MFTQWQGVVHSKIRIRGKERDLATKQCGRGRDLRVDDLDLLVKDIQDVLRKNFLTINAKVCRNRRLRWVELSSGTAAV